MKDMIWVDSTLRKFFGGSNKKYVRVAEALSQLELSKLNVKHKNAEQLMKLFIYRGVKGISNFPALIKSIDEIQAIELGFSKNEKNELELPKKRTYNDFFQKKIDKKTKDRLNYVIEKVLCLANKHNVLLDIDLVTKTIRKKKKDDEEEFKKAMKLIKKLVYPLIDIKMHHNSKFNTKDLLDVLVHVAYTHDFANDGSVTFKELNKNAKVPSGDVMLHHFNKFNDMDDVKIIFDRVFDVIFKYAKKNYAILRRRKLDIALDLHYIPFFGDENSPYVVETKRKDGTSHFYCFLTCSVTIPGKRFIIDALPMSKYDRLENLVDEIIRRVKNKINVGVACLDRGFNSAAIVNTLKKNKIKFLMPKIKNKPIYDWFDRTERIHSKLVRNFQYGTKEKAVVNLYLVNDEDGVKRTFITNLNIPEQDAPALYKIYSKRWGIETSYRQIDIDLFPRTTSTNFTIRLFYFLFSVCLFNLWVLVNIIVSISLYGRIKKKPIITVKRFAVVLYRIYIDVGWIS